MKCKELIEVIGEDAMEGLLNKTCRVMVWYGSTPRNVYIENSESGKIIWHGGGGVSHNFFSMLKGGTDNSYGTIPLAGVHGQGGSPFMKSYTLDHGKLTEECLSFIETLN